MLLNDIGRNLEAVAVLGVHGNAVRQLVAVGELLLLELPVGGTVIVFQVLSDSSGVL